MIHPPDLQLHVQTGSLAWSQTRRCLSACDCSSDFFRAFTFHTLLSSLHRSVAWLLRFSHNTRPPGVRNVGPMNIHELNNSLNTLVKLVQGEVFADRISTINKGRSLFCPLRRLDSFVDINGFLRVGGRLRHSNLPYDVKHPFLLPKAHHLTILIINHYHLTHLHAGPSTLVNILR